MVFNLPTSMFMRWLRSILALTWMEMLGIALVMDHMSFLFNGLNDLVQNEGVEPAWPIHEGNLLCRAKPMDFEDDLIDAHICHHTQSFHKGRGGQPVTRMITLLAILLDMLTTSDA